MAKGGSKLLTAIISFLLGFIFAILVEAGAIFGVYWFVTNKDLTSLMGMFGIQNVDGDGNYIYINTDKDNGGASNLKELLAGIKGLVYENGELSAPAHSFNDFSTLIPATDILLNMVYSVVDDYIEIDHEEFEKTPMTELVQVLSDSLMNVKTATLLEKLNVTQVTGEDANLIVKSILMGSETEYAIVYGGDGEELKLPVLYDIYVHDEQLGYQREMPVHGVSAYPENLSGNYDWLCPISKDEDDGEFTYSKYTLYYVPCRVTANGIEEAEYINGTYTFTDGSGSSAKAYTFPVLEYGANTDFIVVKPDEDGNYIIDYDEVYSSLNVGANDYSYRFDGYSYYGDYARNYYYTAKNSTTSKYEIKTVSGKNYFRNSAGKLVQMDALTLGDVMYDTFTPLDSVPAYTLLGENSDMAYQLLGKISVGELMRGEVDTEGMLDNFEIGWFVTDVKVTDGVMAYLGYGVCGINAGGGSDGLGNYYTYTGKARTDGGVKDCYLTADSDGFIADVWYVEDGRKVEVGSKKVSEVPLLVNNFKSDMTIGDVIDLKNCDNLLLLAIKDEPIDNLESAINNLTVDKIFTEDEINSSAVLRNLRGTRLNELAEAIDGLLIQTVYAEEIYGVPAGSDPVRTTEYRADRLYYVKEGDAFKLVTVNAEGLTGETAYDDALGHLTEEQFNGGEYYTYGEAKGMWRLVLYKNGSEKAYSFNNFNNMVASCAENINSATLKELKEAGIITAEISEKKLVFSDGSEKLLEEITLTELIDIVLGMAKDAEDA